MAGIVYGLCAISAFICAWLLLQAYRANRYKIVLWGGLCFLGLTLTNILLILDKTTPDRIDLTSWRLSVELISILILLYGLIWDMD